ncbi:MAG: LuxR C-terminal-related transcriptional regulator [Bryobacteraceae bacterium]
MNEQTGDHRIRLLLLDNRTLFRASLSHLLASQRGLEIVGECGSPAEALEMLHGSRVDVVLVDPDHATEGADGLLSAARRSGYQGRFLVVADAADARKSALAIRLGGSGTFLTSEAPDRLVRAITLVANGSIWLDQRVIQLLADQSVYRPLQMEDWKSRYLLSDRQQNVLLGILEGLTNGKIAANLGVSERAVKVTVQQLFLKTGVRKRSRLVRAVLEDSMGAAK